MIMSAQSAVCEFADWIVLRNRGESSRKTNFDVVAAAAEKQATMNQKLGSCSINLFVKIRFIEFVTIVLSIYLTNSQINKSVLPVNFT